MHRLTFVSLSTPRCEKVGRASHEAGTTAADLAWFYKPTLHLTGCRTIDKVGRFCLPTKIVRFYCPTETRCILDDKIGQLFGYRSPR